MIIIPEEINNLKGTELLPTTILPDKGATVISRITKGASQDKMVFGRIIRVDKENNIVLFNHFNNMSGSKEKELVLKKCDGCEIGLINAEAFKEDVRSKCLIVEHIENSFLISPYRWHKQHHDKRVDTSTYYYEGISENHLEDVLRYNSAFKKGIIQHNMISHKLTQQEHLIRPADNIKRHLERRCRYNIAYQRIFNIRNRVAANESDRILFYLDGSV